MKQILGFVHLLRRNVTLDSKYFKRTNWMFFQKVTESYKKLQFSLKQYKLMLTPFRPGKLSLDEAFLVYAVVVLFMSAVVL